MIKILISMLLLVTLFGCNTVAGIGKDIQGSAEYIHGKIPNSNSSK